MFIFSHGFSRTCVAQAALLLCTASASPDVNGRKLARSVASMREIPFNNLMRFLCNSCLLKRCSLRPAAALFGQPPMADRASERVFSST